MTSRIGRKKNKKEKLKVERIERLSKRSKYAKKKIEQNDGELEDNKRP